MFDVNGVFSVSNCAARLTEVNRAFSGAVWQGKRIARKTVESPRMRVLCLSRPDGVADYAQTDTRHLFLVGEAFARIDSVDPGNEWAGRLSARILLDAYLTYGHRFLELVKGNFVIIVVDERQCQCSIYNSHFGISPFYYSWGGERLSFSTSLAALLHSLDHESAIDLTGVAELALFNYPLGERTYFCNVHMLRSAEFLCVSREGIQLGKYWNVKALYSQSQLSYTDALEQGAVLFHDVVNSLAADISRLCVAFTSGFDSRSILAVLDKKPDQFLTYSFGIAGSLNVEIPQRVARQQGVAYRPFILDNEYERVFNENAMRALILSDALSTVERANYSYVFEQLSEFSPVVITGLFGSELLRTFQNVGNIVSPNLVRVVLAADPRAEYRQLISSPTAAVYLAPDILRRVADEVEADIAQAVISSFGDLEPDRRFYMFLLTEGLRKYFGAEVHIERPWITNRFPYLDDEFVEFAFQAPFAGLYSHAIKPTIGNRFHSQYFYAYVINKYRPSLLAAQTDHGHSPKDLLSPFALLRIGPKYLFWRWWRERIKYREFKTEEWTEALYREHLYTRPLRRDLFSQRLSEDFNGGMWKMRRSDFAKAASLKLWLETME